MKRKAIIFPYNAECASLVRNRELLLNHEIVACVSPIGYGLQGKDAAYAYGGENTGIVISDKKISEINFDDLLVCESSSDFDTFIMPQVKLAAECGKNVIFLYNISQQQKKEAEETCKKKNVKCVVLTNRRMDTDKLFEHEIIPLSVPVVFVASVIENTNKFDVQLGLRKFLQEEGYKVSQIGTKEYCELFGFHAIPEFMYANQLSEADKIVWFNRICKSIELQEKDSCNCLPVKVDDVYAAVLAVIKEQIQVFVDREMILKEHHNDSRVIRQEQVYMEAVNKCVKEMDRLMELKSGLYADYTEELLDEKEYLQLNREYSQRIEKLKIQADEYRQAASQYESAEKTVAQLKAEMLRFKGKRKLTQEMVDLFVAQVRIYENKNLEIVLNYEDELKKFAELNMEREAG